MGELQLLFVTQSLGEPDMEYGEAHFNKKGQFNSKL